MTDKDTNINDILNKLNIKIETIGGQCPVQAHGTVFGTAFYFRARGQAYSLAIGEVPVEIPEYRKGWYVKKSWGEHKFDAGYMSVNLALLLIAKHTIDYINEQKLGCCDNWNIPILSDIINMIENINNEFNVTRSYTQGPERLCPGLVHLAKTNNGNAESEVSE